jgi:hypothetical protein
MSALPHNLREAADAVRTATNPFEFARAVASHAEALMPRVPSLEGQHYRSFPDYSGFTEFEVYRARDGWHWSAVDDDGCHRGFCEGPFATDAEAYANATGEEIEEEEEEDLADPVAQGGTP